MINVLSLPRPSDARGDTTNAIHRVVLMLEKHLPDWGFQLVEDPNVADLIVGHAGQTSGVGPVQVAHCHGLYWTAYPEQTSAWHFAANAGVIANLRAAKQITVPSQWVADVLRRDMHVNPHVVPWAIEASEWEPGEDQGYVLWNKTREDGVCTPKPLLDLAAKVGHVRFLTTFGHGTPNVKTIGRQPYDQMRQLVRGAAVYLATTLETFGIGTLEAMASGVPVLGFRWGGTADLVQHGVTGYLVEPGDIEGLVEGLSYCLTHRATLGANARSMALAYTWDRVAERMASVYMAALHPHYGPKVSVVIPCHNYGHYVVEAIASVKAQQTTFEWELIVVNDGSTDNSFEVIKEALSDWDAGRGQHIGFPTAHGPASARNAGIARARGEYIVCLDADDKLGDPAFLQVLADALDAEPALGMAFTGLRLMDEMSNPGQQTNWPNGYSFDLQRTTVNQVPTCCMFRREAWLRAGGYRSRYVPAEDANLWLRMGSLGYLGRQVTREPWFWYRWHNKSLSTPVRLKHREEPNWRDFPWVADGQPPFAADGDPHEHSWPVRHYIRPKVSVVIPVGPSHTDVLADALDSVERQSERQWECIVVNDSGQAIDLTAYPWVRLIVTRGGQGAGFARNRGVEAARASLVTFLDADDYFDMRFLEGTLREYAISGRYIYTDWRSLNKAGRYEEHETPDFDPNEVFQCTSIHSINVLIPRAWVLAVGGFDETMYSAEDVDFFMKLAAAGYCGKRLGRALVTYRYTTGSLRESGVEETAEKGLRLKSDLLALLNARYGEYIRGEKTIACRETSPRTSVREGNYKVYPSENGHNGMVRVEYQGPAARAACIGMATKTNYGQRAHGDIFLVWEADVHAAPERFLPIADLFDDVTSTPAPPEPVLIEELSNVRL